MCGFIGIMARDGNVAYDLYFALHTLQHRGQNGTGILTFDKKEFYLKKGPGLVNEFYNEENLPELKGNVGIAHVRYPTVSSNPVKDAQPFLISREQFRGGLCHNGNLVNYEELKGQLTKKGYVLNSGNDAEIILGLLANELKNICKEKKCSNEHFFANAQKCTNEHREPHERCEEALLPKHFLANAQKCTEQEIFTAIKNVVQQLNGGYSCVTIIDGKLAAFRDQNAIRPLIFGQKIKDGKVIAYGFASESVALDTLGFKIIKDLEPGEAVIVDENMKYNSKIVLKGQKKHCMFEWVYFARPDSVIENTGVYGARLNLGEELAKIWGKKGLAADIVVPVPDTSRTAAISFAQAVGLPYREGLIKNRYIGRTFIMPHQKKREFGVRIKLSPVIRELKDKSVILIDDSIVRGTTSKKIIEMVRAAGAKEVHFMVTCPPIKHPCFYAIDMASTTELIAAEKNTEEIRKEIGADSLIYQEIEPLKSSIGLNNNLCMACLTGNYPTEVSEATKKMLGTTRDTERNNWIDPLKADVKKCY